MLSCCHKSSIQYCMQMPSEMQAEVGYPDMLQHFHSLYPLEDSRSASERPSKAFGVQSEVLKGVSMHDGTAFAIRKFGWRQVGLCCRRDSNRHTQNFLSTHTPRLMSNWF